MLNTVKVPQQFEPLFEKAQEYVARFFSERKEDPTQGTIEIFGERYILVRAASLSFEFFETIVGLYQKEGKEEGCNIARQLLFDIAHAIGKQDARNFHKKMHLHDPMEKLSAGPVHFAHAGWAFVDIFPESSPSPDENYYLIYDHPYSFESEAWLAAGKKSEFPVCIMNAGYSSGWCEESFGLELIATEIMCKTKGDPACRFIMSPPAHMEGHIAAYMKKEPELAKQMTKYEVPGFFKRKEAEEQIRKMNEELEAKVTERTQQLVAAQEELLRTEKLTLLGQVADTVGHELRNPLGVMNNAVYFLQTVLSDADDTTKEYLNIIKDEITDAERIVSDLLDAVRTKLPQPEAVEVAELMRQSLRKRNVPSTVTVKLDIPEDISPVRVDPLQMHQVLWNLITNGLEAMPDGGLLEISANEGASAQTVKVSVRDSGSGIAPEHQSKLFQPMFTTKARRVGLGLVVVKNLTEINGGSVEVESELGKGSVFTVTLPCGA
ncbi:ATP-binding protein [Ferrovum myxofaciens]|uniref:histidine kinase n=1 Tax=Ferrovum myxofaciens TaxID=416213 RepID=A0A9E6MWH4_9PROT|nr:ATP-binding protein [Ferrovum myxofaciens]QKE39481.1 MAG: XylR N-terminal domain-containing protein [Ferrovum myxofaciens]QWY74758.1 MAG: XylR N-terminal domain-containing protein [Ferrovum myxofaciens]QWY77504.1 MAG: XylR N-terminal domain-containing protein [Ferrovum myxofaciens]